MLEKYTLSDKFKEIFINQTYEEDIYIKDMTINSNISYYLFFTFEVLCNII